MVTSAKAAPAENVVEQEFNALATQYESNRLAGWYKAHADEMLNHVAQLDDCDILDVGCATGYFLRSYIKNKTNVRAIGIDTSAAMVEQARRLTKEEPENTSKTNILHTNSTCSKQIKFIHANWEQLDLNLFQDYKFKAIFCANTFHYFADPKTATQKLFQLLAADGTLYILERNKARSPLTFLWGFLHSVFIKDQVTFYKTSELVGFFEKAGFADIKVLSSIKKYFWKNKLFTSIVLIKGSKKNNG